MKSELFQSLLYLVLLIHSNIFAQELKEPMSKGKFEPTWQSLQQYKVPTWFRDAKFGIWAHWGPQCQPEQGDWYARSMYIEGSREYNWHVKNYGHPSEFGFKDVCNAWKAENWNPDKLIKLYKKAGAKYFFALANHHDNFDNWDSKYQPWNSVNIGPKKDIIKDWAEAARKNHLYFGTSIHAAHAWIFYETSQRSDKNGDKKGITYDGKLTKDQGKGTWWENYNPQKLYVQNHPLSDGIEQNSGAIHKHWEWQNGASKPSDEFCTNIYNRTLDLINKYNPDLLYFDDTTLPFYPINNVGLEIATHFYNHYLATHNGKMNAVIFGKILDDEQKKAIVWDVERGTPDKIQKIPWQTCSCIGEWHYRRAVYDENRYKSAKTVVNMLADIVSKNGNLLLNIPVRGDGTIDEKEIKIVEEIGEWMKINGEAIYETRSWKIFGEGPIAEKNNPINAQGFNEGKQKYTEKDIRFTSKKKIVYVILMDKPSTNKVIIHSFSKEKKLYENKVKNVQLLGYGNVQFEQNAEGLIIELPHLNKFTDFALAFKIK